MERGQLEPDSQSSALGMHQPEVGTRDQVRGKHLAQGDDYRESGDEVESKRCGRNQPVKRTV